MNIANIILPVIIILSIWNLIITIILILLFTKITSFTKNTNQKDLLSALNELLKNTRSNQQQIEATNKRLEAEIERSKLNFKKIGFKRFNPFTDTGGDQSFTLCLLDENNDGFVISSLHSRENTRLYAKKLVGGNAPDQILSKEEKEVIKQAQK